MVELGRIDIFCEVSMMSSQLALPREGHLDQVFHILEYINPPNIYLGGQVKKTRFPNMVEACNFSLIQYVQEAVSNLEKFLQDLDESMLSMKINAPLSNGYRPELGISPELDGSDGAYYQSLIGILW